MLTPNKLLGQNFLKDSKIIDTLLASANLKPEDVVLEVGPGMGAVTEKLILKAKQVIAIEKDQRLVDYLKNKFKNKNNLKIISGDILRIQYSQLIRHSSFVICHFKVIASLPFYLTSRFLRLTLENDTKPALMSLIIQKEVAERICQGPPNASMLSNSVQFYADPKIIQIISKTAFDPEPEVDAAIIKLNILKEPRVKVDNIKEFFKLLKIGFLNKRKQLHNNLSSGYKLTNQEANQILSQANINPTRRAQTLSLEEWAKLYQKLKSQNSNIKTKTQN